MNNRGHLVYPSAACGVVWDYLSNKQVIFNQHDDDVICVALHPNQVYAATGQVGKDDMVNIWDTHSGALVQKIETQSFFKEGGVLAICFSNNGSSLAVVGGNPLDSTLLVYNWQEGTLIARGKCHTEPIFCLSFSPEDDRIVMCGKDAIKFFSIESKGLVARQGVFYPRGTTQSLYSCTFDQKGNTICGTKDGSIYVFNGNKLVQKYTAHSGPLFSIYPLPTGDGFATSGKDGVLRVWLYTGAVTENQTCEFKLAAEMNLGSEVRTILPDVHDDGVFFAIKYNGDFLKVNIHDKTIAILTKSHSGDGELWGLTTIPGTGLFVSGADDSRIIIWNSTARTYEKDIRVPRGKVRAVATNGADLAASTFEGSVFVYKLSSISSSDSNPVPFKEIKDGREELASLTYSPDGKLLAVGSHDNNVYLHNTQGYELITKLSAHQSYVKHVDFSADGKWLQSCCGAYELLYWDLAKKAQHKTPHELKDVQWATQNCTLGWGVRGMWLTDMDGTDINGVDVHFQRSLIVCADDRGLVRILRYPTLSEPSESVNSRGHCSHVTTPRFNERGDRIFSTGGGDLTIIQWKI
jgi:microtubule-associated protein-like 1/2